MTHKQAFARLFPGIPYDDRQDPDEIMLMKHLGGNVTYLSEKLTSLPVKDVRWILADEVSGRNRKNLVSRLAMRLGRAVRDDLIARASR